MEVEPWMRNTHTELDPIRRGVLHVLELTEEDVQRWCAGLDQEQMFARPLGLPPVAFQLRHIVRSLDRLLTYAEGRLLEQAQLDCLASEMEKGEKGELLQEFEDGVAKARERILQLRPEQYAETRGIGRSQLPTTLGGMLVHCAEHTARHLGQAVTTAKVAAGSSN